MVTDNGQGEEGGWLGLAAKPTAVERTGVQCQMANELKAEN